MLRVLLSKLPASQKRRLRDFYNQTKRQFITRFRSYGAAELEASLRAVGIETGETVLLHSSFDAFSGFRGSPRELIDVFLRRIGTDGNLLMVSLPFTSSTYEYLQHQRVFDVRRTPSRMGLISETFRRREGVLRSFHPTHPVLALGPKAEWIVADHDQCLYACGPGSPFEKLSVLEGKMVFFNVSYRAMTFFHYLEHLVQPQLTFPLYYDGIFEAPAVQWNGTKTVVKARVASLEAIARRRPEVLFAELRKRGFVKEATVGNSRVMALETSKAIACTMEMARRGSFFYESTGVRA